MRNMEFPYDQDAQCSDEYDIIQDLTFDWKDMIIPDSLNIPESVTNEDKKVFIKKRRRYTPKPSARELAADKLERRRQNNRVSARNSRLRKKLYIQGLERENEALKEHVEVLMNMLKKSMERNNKANHDIMTTVIPDTDEESINT